MRRYGQHRGGADTGTDRGAAVRRARDQFVGQLLGTEAGKLLAQRREVADRDPGSVLDDPVGDMCQRRLGARASLAYPSFDGVQAPAPAHGAAVVLPGRFERGREASLVVVTYVVLGQEGGVLGSGLSAFCRACAALIRLR